MVVYTYTHNTKSSTCDILLQFSKKWMIFPINNEAIWGVVHLSAYMWTCVVSTCMQTCVQVTHTLHMWGEQEDIR